ncbi:FMN-binding negative transcriptional regulator [uncultured Xylophilus sp.]|uniref:FMN-binding negative transcriptional regulator n=1 Tax=uncultured Xylophilus sp. TaxID=296832 RepID=UPI0025DA0730|nr:FMN-binding negative transcriptional regulator [uncultured Xylophilus sp.]
MYLPAHFAENDPDLLQAAATRAPLGMLVTHTADGGLDAQHLPFEWDRAAGGLGVLRCHVARANPVWQDAAAANPAQPLPTLVVFRGPDAYVSPSLYPSKQTHHRVVPTWNYVAVHAHGRIAVHDDPRWLRGLLARLTRRFEAARPAPWKMGDAPADYLEAQIAQIVGLEIVVERVEGKWKMSQNRTAADQQGVVDGLAGSADPRDRAVAETMAQVTAPLNTRV